MKVIPNTQLTTMSLFHVLSQLCPFQSYAVILESLHFHTSQSGSRAVQGAGFGFKL